MVPFLVPRSLQDVPSCESLWSNETPKRVALRLGGKCASCGGVELCLRQNVRATSNLLPIISYIRLGIISDLAHIGFVLVIAHVL